MNKATQTWLSSDGDERQQANPKRGTSHHKRALRFEFEFAKPVVRVPGTVLKPPFEKVASETLRVIQQRC